MIIVDSMTLRNVHKICEKNKKNLATYEDSFSKYSLLEKQKKYR